jgi:hypothetical protein
MEGKIMSQNITALTEVNPVGYVRVTPIVGTLVEKINSSNRNSEAALHRIITPLISDINVIDAEAASIAQEMKDQE